MEEGCFRYVSLPFPYHFLTILWHLYYLLFRSIGDLETRSNCYINRPLMKLFIDTEEAPKAASSPLTRTT